MCASLKSSDVLLCKQRSMASVLIFILHAQKYGLSFYFFLEPRRVTIALMYPIATIGKTLKEIKVSPTKMA